MSTMQGLSTILSGADNRENARIWAGAPTFDGVEFIHLFGRSLGQSVRNLCPGKPDAVVMGNPTVNANFLAGGGAANFIQTRTRDWIAGTYIVVARTSDTLADNDHRPLLMGTADEFASAGSALYADDEDEWRQNAYFDISDVPTAVVADNVSVMTDWTLLIGEFSTTALGLANMNGTPDRGTGTPSTTDRLIGHQNIGIMGNTGTFRRGSCEVALAIGLSRVMVDAAERLAWKVAIQRLLAGTEIVIP